jgi:hypothetical protein
MGYFGKRPGRNVADLNETGLGQLKGIFGFTKHRP